MEQFSPTEAEEQKEKITFLLNERLPRRVALKWDSNNMHFIDKTSGKTILVAHYGHPPYPKSGEDIGQLLQYVESKISNL